MELLFNLQSVNSNIFMTALRSHLEGQIRDNDGSNYCNKTDLPPMFPAGTKIYHNYTDGHRKRYSIKDEAWLLRVLLRKRAGEPTCPKVK